MDRLIIDGDETTAMRPRGETRLISCGWCLQPTDPDEHCQHCGHEDPARPWTQRDQTPPKVGHAAGRPKLDVAQVRQRLRTALTDRPGSTNGQLAEDLDVSESTVRRWRQISGL